MICCPHCSGTTGYVYDMKVTTHMAGEWGMTAEFGDSTTTIIGLARCLDCGRKVRAETAEGKNKAAAQEGQP